MAAESGNSSIWRACMARVKSLVSSTTSPSRKTTIRRAIWATSWSWVTRMTVMPLSSIQLAEELDDFLARAGVEVARRLVAHQDRRVVDQRPGDGDALLLAAGKLARMVVQPVAQADAAEQARWPGDGAAGGDAADRRAAAVRRFPGAEVRSSKLKF